MLYSILAQSTLTFNGQVIEDDGALAGFSAGIFLAVIAIAIPLIIVMLAAMWKMFEKAGVEGWKAIIPVYNGWVMSEIAGKPGWWGIVGLAGVVPVVGFIASIASLVLSILISIELAKAFKRSGVFAIFGLILFPLVGYLILGFGNDKYESPVKNAPAAGPTPAPAGNFAVPQAAALDQTQPAPMQPTDTPSAQPPSTPAA